MAQLLSRYFYTTMAIALGFLCSLNARGATAAAENLLSLSLEELLQVKITSSTLTDESLKTVPASVTLFTRAQIQQLGINTLDKLMNHVPGYQSYSSDVGTINYSSRSRRQSNSTCEVLVLMDGQRLDHDVVCGMSFTDGSFSLANIERVEFIRGPGSAIYGANAFLGVINIITAKNQNRISASGGNHSQKQAALSLSHQFDNGLQTSLFAQTHSADIGQSRLFDPFTQEFADGHQQQSENQSIYWQASWSDWSLQLRHVTRQNHDGYSFGNLSADSSEIEVNSNLFAINYAHQFNPQWKFNNRVYYAPYRSNLSGANTPTSISTIIFNGSNAGVENQLTWREGNSNALLGANFSQFTLSDSDIFSGTPATVLSRTSSLETNDRSIKALYGQWQDKLSEHFSYITGVRNDNYSDTKGHTSPRLGLIYQHNEENTLKLLYGEAFRAPARLELYLRNNPRQVGNPNLKPEIVRTSELIWMRTNETHYFSISLFHTQIKQPVVLRETPVPRAYINGEQQRMSGMELESKWTLNYHWQLETTLSHMFNSPRALNHDAEDLFSTSLIYIGDKMTLSLSGIYHGKSYDANDSPSGYSALSSYTLIDVHAQYQIASEWNIYANIRNLADKVYIQPAFQNGANFYGVPGTGREMEVGISWSF